MGVGARIAIGVLFPEEDAERGIDANTGSSARCPRFAKQTRKLAAKFPGLIKFA